MSHITKAAADVLAERKRQIEIEGWSLVGDIVRQRNGRLAAAAACYAMPRDRLEMYEAEMGAFSMIPPSPKAWPWLSEWWKPTTRRRDLVKAGALILAEIERLDNAELLIKQGVTVSSTNTNARRARKALGDSHE